VNDELTKVAAELFPDEVVTKALVRYLDLPLGAGRFALVTLDNGLDHTRPNTFGPGGLASLDAALDEIERADVVGVGITGKPNVFAAGADVTGFQVVNGRDQALAIGRAGHKV
jgi:enoyl-CoA hydratase/carnithine racemase